MKKIIVTALIISGIGISCAMAQDIKAKDVPAAVKDAFTKKYPAATKVSWERENGNYEANWGGSSGEDSSVQFSPAGAFIECVKAIKVSELPAAIVAYVKQHNPALVLKKLVR